MDKKSEEELEKIANQITVEMVRNLDGLRRPPAEPASAEAVPGGERQDEEDREGR